MSASEILKGDSRLALEGIKTRIGWYAALSVCLGGMIYVYVLSYIVSFGVLLITYYPIVHFAPHFAASLHPDKTSGWFPLLHCAEFPIFFPLPTTCAILAIIGLRRLYRYGNAMLGLCCTERYLMWMWVMYSFALTCVAFALILACFFGANTLAYL